MRFCSFHFARTNIFYPSYVEMRMKMYVCTTLFEKYSSKLPLEMTVVFEHMFNLTVRINSMERISKLFKHNNITVMIKGNNLIKQ